MFFKAILTSLELCAPFLSLVNLVLHNRALFAVIIMRYEATSSPRDDNATLNFCTTVKQVAALIKVALKGEINFAGH